MQYAHSPGIELYGIVNKICHGLHSLIHAHTAHINLPLESKLTRTRGIGC